MIITPLKANLPGFMYVPEKCLSIPHLRDPIKSAKSDVTSRKSSTKRSSWHGTSHQHDQQKIQLEEVTVDP